MYFERHNAELLRDLVACMCVTEINENTAKNRFKFYFRDSDFVQNRGAPLFVFRVFSNLEINCWVIFK